METYPIVIGTAGHIDHGKTALVRALTGIDTDRLKVEKERGITTELGFAHLDLDGRRYGVVDVPGHERFIKSMVSGAGGLDLVCLVIAADEGVMPQTREHLDICQLLGVRHWVVALGQSDLVEDEWLELVTEDVREHLSSTFLSGAELIPVSAKTGTGLDRLRSAVVELTAELPARTSEGPFRLPLDRVFTIRGFGTVVTGTVLSGAARVGDSLLVHPRGSETKIRGVEVHGEAADTARAGMRCAINLAGLSTSDVSRGDVLGHPGAVAPSHILDARFRYLRTSRAPLGRRSRVLLHHATTQLMGTLVLVERDQLEPGEEALVQLRLDASTPVAALPGDRFIVRGFVLQEHYGTTLGGGEILRVQAPKVRRSSADAVDALRHIEQARGDERVALEIKTARAAGFTAEDLARRLGMPPGELEAALERLVAQGEVVRTGGSGGAVHCHVEPFARLEKRALDHVDAFHEAEPHKEGMSREELRARLPRAMPQRLYEALLDALIRREALVADADLVRRPRAGGKPAGDALSPTEERVAAAFADWGHTPPRTKEIGSRLDLGAREASATMDRLLAAGVLLKIKPDLLVHRDAIAELRARLVAHLDEHGQITPAEWKELTGATRKWSIPLAEYFDQEKVTLRVGDIRKRRGLPQRK